MPGSSPATPTPRALRTVKTCVGSEWCRFGTQDSTGLGVKLEKMLLGLVDAAQGQARGVRLPAQLRRGDDQGYRRRLRRGRVRHRGRRQWRRRGARHRPAGARRDRSRGARICRRLHAALPRGGALSRTHRAVGGAGRHRLCEAAAGRRCRRAQRALPALPVLAASSCRTTRGRSAPAGMSRRTNTASSPRSNEAWRTISWIDIGRLDDIPRRGARRVHGPEGAPPIAVFRTADDGVFALVDRCPHRGGPLSEGIVQGRAVACPLHGWVIELDSGEAEAPDEGCARPSRQARRRPHPAGGKRGRRGRLAVGGGVTGDSGIRTTCPYCGVGCGVIATPDGRVIGDPDHPANRGRLCSKGAALAETLGAAGRLLRAADRTVAQASWDEALDLVADVFARTIDEHGPDAVALLCLRPVPDRGLLRRQQADEGLYRHRQYRHQFAAVHGLVGRRACAGLRRGHRARLLRGYRRGRSGRAGRQQHRLVPSGAVPAPRRGPRDARHARSSSSIRAAPPTCDIADLHLPLRPGSDVALFAALLLYLADNGACDRAWIETRTSGFAAAIDSARQSMPTLADAARAADVPLDDLAPVLRLVRARPSAP